MAPCSARVSSTLARRPDRSSVASAAAALSLPRPGTHARCKQDGTHEQTRSAPRYRKLCRSPSSWADDVRTLRVLPQMAPTLCGWPEHACERAWRVWSSPSAHVSACRASPARRSDAAAGAKAQTTERRATRSPGRAHARASCSGCTPLSLPPLSQPGARLSRRIAACPASIMGRSATASRGLLKKMAVVLAGRSPNAGRRLGADRRPAAFSRACSALSPVPRGGQGWSPAQCPRTTCTAGYRSDLKF